MPDNVNTDLNDALTAYTDIFYLLTIEQQKKHKNEIDKYFACNEIGAVSFDDFIKPLSESEREFCASCPTSEQHSVVKNGKGSKNRQRYICKDCGKTFYAVQNSLSSNVNQDMNTWIKFVRGMLRQYSLDELSEDCNISRTTALNWRLRVFQALEIILSKVKLYGNITADDTRLKYNLKGNHKDGFIMPRSSRSRGSSYSMQNHCKNEICVLCAIDENGNSFSRVIGFGTPTAARISEGFKDKVDLSKSDNLLITDGARYFKKAVDTYGFIDWKRQVTIKKGTKRLPNTNSPYHIQRINSYHSRLKRFIRNYNGISSRYLPGYLLLFDYLQNNKNVDDTTLCREILSTMATAPKLTNEELENNYIILVSNNPKEELWEAKVPLEEQKIYKDWATHMEIKEIMRKYRIKRRKIYTIKEKVEKYGLHNIIISKEFARRRHGPLGRKKGPISSRDWQIFIKYYHQGIKSRVLADEYKITQQTIYNIVDALKNRPEAQSISKYVRPQRPTKPQIDYNERNFTIYMEYKFLKVVIKHQKDIFDKLALKYNTTPRYIENLVYSIRESDSTATVKYRWTEERKHLSPIEYYRFLQNRNRKYVSDVDKYVELMKTSRAKALKAIIPLYNLSFASAQRIYYHQSKCLYVYDHYLEKHGIMLPQERVREQEPLPQGP